MEKFKIVNELSKGLFNQLDDVIKTAYWTENRNISDYSKMLDETSYFVGVVEKETDRLVGISRVLTDFTYIAIVVDVIVHEEFRGSSIGKFMLDHIVNCEKLKSVCNLELYCREELISYYSQFGFDDWSDRLKFMRIVRN